MFRCRAALVVALVAMTGGVAATSACAQTAGGAPSSYDLIQQQRDAGKLRPGRAALLGLQAIASPAKVPRAYRGRGPVDGGDLMSDIVAALPKMSGRERRAIRPYLLPPIFRQSAWLPARLKQRARRAASSATVGRAASCSSFNGSVATGAWRGVPAGPTAIVFYPADRPGYRPSAQRYARELRSKILPTLTRLFRKPLSTASGGCDELGGGELQFYVTDPAVVKRVGRDENALAVAPSAQDDTRRTAAPCGPTASFVLLPPGTSNENVAHETMHTVQWAYAMCERAPALIEGGAVLGEDLVYPGTASKHVWSSSVTAPFVGLLSDTGQTEYSAWAFWYALGRPAGPKPEQRSAVVKRIMEALERRGSTLTDVVGSLVPGGWRQQLATYAVQRWNQAPVGAADSPVKESFRQWDRWDAVHKALPTKIKLDGLPESTASYDTSVREPLSTWFQDLPVTDPKVRQIDLSIPDPQDLVQGFVQLADGSWHVRDWSGQTQVSLCRDLPEEDVTRIVVATSNPVATGGPLGSVTYKIGARDSCGNGYRVLAATIKQHLAGTGAPVTEILGVTGGPCVPSGTQDFTLERGPQPYSDYRNTVSAEGSGTIQMRDEGTETTNVTGCTSEFAACQLDNVAKIGESIALDIEPTADPQTLKVTWNLPSPNLSASGGFADPHPGCLWNGITPGGSEPLPYALGEQRVPASVFRSATPQTLSVTFKFTVGATGEDMVTVESTRSITFQRVRDDGAAL